MARLAEFNVAGASTFIAVRLEAHPPDAKIYYLSAPAAKQLAEALEEAVERHLHYVPPDEETET